MITQKELIQKRADFWKKSFLEQTRYDLNMTIGLVKSMSNNAYVIHGKNDDTGLYHASLLAETRLEDFAGDYLEHMISCVINHLVDDVITLSKEDA
jgi:hypothetical protein